MSEISIVTKNADTDTFEEESKKLACTKRTEHVVK